MSNLEKKNLLEANLRKHLRKRRIIEGILLIAFLIMGSTCFSLREASREEIVYGELFLPWKEVHYNDSYIPWIILGVFGAWVMGIILLCDALSCRFATTEVNGHYLTAYRGMTKCVVYINGEEADRLTFSDFRYVIDTKLPDGVKVSISFSRGLLFLAHISFSDNHSPVDL